MRGKILAVAEELLERKQNWQVGFWWFRYKKPLCHLRVLSILRNILGGYSCSAGCAAQPPCRPAYVIAKAPVDHPQGHLRESISKPINQLADIFRENSQKLVATLLLPCCNVCRVDLGLIRCRRNGRLGKAGR